MSLEKLKANRSKKVNSALTENLLLAYNFLRLNVPCLNQNSVGGQG